MMLRLPSRIAAGCALGTDGVHVSLSRWGREVGQFSLDWTDTLAATEWQERLDTLMQELVARGGGSRVAMRIALLPSLLRHRLVSLPAMSLTDARCVLQRDSTRYFCGVEGEQEIAVARIGPEPGAPLSVLAVDRPLLEALEDLARKHRVRLEGVHSACDVWASLVKAGSESATTAAIVAATSYHRLEVRRGRLSAIRHGPARLFNGAVDVHIAADAAWHQQTAGRLTRLGPWPRMVAERTRGIAAGRAWRDAYRFGAAAVFMLLVAGGLDLWGLGRERAQLRAAREAERETTLTALALRDRVAMEERHVAALGTARASAPGWTKALAHLAETLPTDAYLTGLQAAADSAIIEGVAGSAAGVFNALHEMPGVTQVRAVAPIRHERTDGEAAIERFVIGLTLSDSTENPKP